MKGGSGKPLDTRDVVLDFGKHRGSRIQNVPVNYLRFMVRNQTAMWRYAEAEMQRRGSVLPQIEVSGHAIDSASLRVRHAWHEDRDEKEGLHAWLCRRAWEAWNLRQTELDEKVDLAGVRWVFDRDGVWPILKTVYPAKRGAGAAGSEDEGEDRGC